MGRLLKGAALLAICIHAAAGSCYIARKERYGREGFRNAVGESFYRGIANQTSCEACCECAAGRTGEEACAGLVFPPVQKANCVAYTYEEDHRLCHLMGPTEPFLCRTGSYLNATVNVLIDCPPNSNTSDTSSSVLYSSPESPRLTTQTKGTVAASQTSLSAVVTDKKGQEMGEMTSEKAPLKDSTSFPSVRDISSSVKIEESSSSSTSYTSSSTSTTRASTSTQPKPPTTTTPYHNPLAKNAGFVAAADPELKGEMILAYHEETSFIPSWASSVKTCTVMAKKNCQISIVQDNDVLISVSAGAIPVTKDYPVAGIKSVKARCI